MSEINEAEVRAEVRDWLQANWNPKLSLIEWRNKLADSGWGMPQWPKEWFGRGLPMRLAPIVEEEFAAIGAVGVARAGIRLLAAATLLEHGTDLHKKKFLRRILTGEDTGANYSVSPAVVRTSPALRRVRILTATDGSSMVRKCGLRVPIMLITERCWRGPIGTSPSTRGCRILSSILDNQASMYSRSSR